MKKLIIIAILTTGIIKLGIAQDSANVNTVDPATDEIIDFQDSISIDIVEPPGTDPVILPTTHPAAEEAPVVKTPDKQDSDNGNVNNEPEAGKKKEKKEKKVKVKKEKKANPDSNREKKEKVEEKPAKDESADDSQKKTDDPRSKKEKITDAVVKGLGVVLITIAMILFFG